LITQNWGLKMQPFDYRIAVQDPLQMALAGYQQGQQFQNQRVQAERETQLYDMEMQQYQANQAKLQQEEAFAQEMQADLGQFANDIEAGTATREQLNRLKFKYGAVIGEHVDAAYEGATQEYKDAQASKIAKIGIAFTRSPEEGMRLLQVEKEAAQNAGDQQLVDSIEMMEGEAKISAGAPTASALFVLGSLVSPERLDAYKAIVLPERPEAASGEGKVLQDYQNGFFGPVGSPEAIEKAEQALENQKRVPLIGSITGETLKTGQLAPETALVEDLDAPGGLRIIPIAGGTAQDVKATAIASADDVIKTLNDLKTAKGASNRYGLSSVGGLAPAVPGSDEANAQAIINKVKGQAFLTALDSLRGTGTITEIEGAKATQAVTVLSDQNISWPFALAAADELIGIVEAARKRKAGAMGGPPIGTVEDGFVFQGGDPADQNNWKLQ
jgi:hypothetical protein